MSEVALLGIYSITGEGLIVELSENDEVALYDKQGLQYRIISRQKAGLNTDVEENTLAQITNINQFV
ncbi:MAG: hypothetical protein ACI9J2_001820 [Saprospiraceae bacterium]|jgi:hypothetical protein